MHITPESPRESIMEAPAPIWPIEVGWIIILKWTISGMRNISMPYTIREMNRPLERPFRVCIFYMLDLFLIYFLELAPASVGMEDPRTSADYIPLVDESFDPYEWCAQAAELRASGETQLKGINFYSCNFKVSNSTNRALAGQPILQRIS